MFLNDVSKALAQIFDPKFRGVLLKSLAITIAALAATVWLVNFALGFVPPISFTLPVIDQEVTFLDEAAQSVGFWFAVVASIFLMFPVAAVIVGFFLEEIADAVEAKHFPGLPAARDQGFKEIAVNAGQFLLALIGANILALIVYLVLMFTLPPFAWLSFVVVNGYLLGREYFELVAMRRMPLDDVKALRQKYLGRIWMAGILMAAPLSIPFLNLLVPVIGVAAFTHTFHRLRAKAGA